MDEHAPTDERPDGGARITAEAGGPYRVTGGLPLIRRRMVVSEHGEPMAWQTTERLGSRETFALCRCGDSAKKPYCDGSHSRNGFDPADAPRDGSYDERARTYQATGIVMRDDRSVCVHAGFCGNRLTNVWKMTRGNDTEDSITRAALMAMIERCPSGALTYRLEPEGADIEPELAAEVGVVDDGPLFVTGNVPVQLADGTLLEVRNRVTLCRCGSSAAKPYCDGSHKEAGFKDA